MNHQESSFTEPDQTGKPAGVMKLRNRIQRKSLTVVLTLLSTSLLLVINATTSFAFDSSNDIVLENDAMRLVYRADGGSFDITLPHGEYLVKRGYGRATYERGGLPWKASTIEYGNGEAETHPFSDEIGSGTELVVEYPGVLFKPDLIHTIRIYDNRPVATFSLTIRNSTVGILDVTSLSPVYLLGRAGGGLYIGLEPSTHRVLDNGSFKYVDMAARITPGNQVVCSNWNAAHYDYETGRSLVSGFLTFERTVPTITTKYASAFAVPDPVTGYIPFTFFAGTCSYTDGKPVMPTASLESEFFYLDADLFGSTQNRLEEYAACSASASHWPHWEGAVPVGWNSWGPDAYGHEITEQLMLDNLDFVKDVFRDWGWNYFQIDDGWQQDMGDWEANEDFPHGMGWLADRIWEAGLIPGIWINPMNMSTTSELLHQHPDWAAPMGPLGLLIWGQEWLPLDPTIPDVQDWLHDLMDEIAHDWGYGYIKIDFTYRFLFCKDLYDPYVTPEEAYRTAFSEMRSGMGAETFLKGIVPQGLGAGYCDGERITLDNEPVWEVEGGGGSIGEQSIKAIYRTAARRYYLEGNQRINHPDAIFFRDPISRDESITWATAVGLMGGIVSVGERLVELTDDDIEIIRSIIPVYGGETGQPLDLFELDYPEFWHQHIDHNTGSWDIVGLFNWGKNRDLINQRNLREQTRRKGFRCTDIGLDENRDYTLFDFWNRQLIGTFHGDETVELTLLPRTVRLLSIRETEDNPQFISTSRHFTQGAISLLENRWESSTRRLTVRQEGVKDGKFITWCRIPDGFTLETWEIDGAHDAEVIRDGELLTIRFTCDETGGTVTINLQF